MSEIVDLNKLQNVVTALKKDGKKVGLCHGVFDLLHLGHVYYLEEAKSLCDILIVTITDCKFVNKGPGRPIFNAKERTKALSSLNSVDFVAINQWKTAINTIKQIKPDIYIKGPDYQDSSQDPTDNLKKEMQAIELVGGKFEVTNGQQYSSSRIINLFYEEDKAVMKFRENIRKKFSSTDVKAKLDTFKDLKVLIIGEAILDTYVFCETVGKAGKDPFLVSKKKRTEVYLGGSLAGANNISEFVNSVKVLTYLGDRDTNIDLIKENLNSNISIDYVKKIDSPTINKTRFVDEITNTKINGVYDINNNELCLKDEKKFLKKLEKIIDKFDLVIAMDFGHGLFTKEIVDLVSKKAKFLAVNIQQNSFNSGFYDISKFSKADLFTLHEGEMRQHFRDKVTETDELILKLYQKSKFKNVIVTRGKKGSILKAKDQKKPIFCPGLAKDIVDRVGSGDALLVATSLALAKGLSPDFSLLFGSIAASEIIKDHANANMLKKDDVSNTLSTFLK
tara:strand:+ start:4227 stop:5744 length:1518 start_codon:yes stop_codon:yes gene_type:complete